MLKIIITDFEDILPIWKNELWQDRQSEIKPLSSIPYLGGCDMSIYNNIPTFWKITDGSKTVGVNSGFKTADGYYRSRGIWIHKGYRGQGLATILFTELDKRAKIESCNCVWSIPRKSAIQAYEKAGFKQTSDWFDEGMEFGPNCYVLKEI